MKSVEVVIAITAGIIGLVAWLVKITRWLTQIEGKVERVRDDQRDLKISINERMKLFAREIDRFYQTGRGKVTVFRRREIIGEREHGDSEEEDGEDA